MSSTHPQLDTNGRLIVFLAVIVHTCLVQFDLTLAAGIQTNSRAEAWVLARIMADQVADLADPSAKLPNSRDWILSSSFLEKLVVNPAQSELVKRHGIRIKNAVFQERIDLSSATISHSLSLQECRFEQEVDLSSSVVRENISFYQSRFDKEKKASFSHMRVEGHAMFRETVFTGPVDFTGARIDGQFDATRAQFRFASRVVELKSDANFDGMEVRQSALFDGAVFRGQVEFGNARIGLNLGAREAKFLSTSLPASFNGMSVGDLADFEGAHFAGSVDFIGIRVGGQFVANRARFTNVNSSAQFNGMQVRDTVFFRDAEFAGPVDFKFAHMSLNFTADRAHFTNLNQNIRFDGMSVDGIVSFEETEFKGPVVLSDMVYRQIRVKKDTEYEWWKSLIALIDRSSYSVTSYTNLEVSLRKEGYAQYADEVFIAQKWRERTETLHPLAFEYWINWFLYLLVAYGRRPSCALLWSILFIVIGYFTFRKSKMVVRNQNYFGEIYSPFWFSVGLFLPLVNLYAAEVWRPKKEYWFARNYMRVHILFGWILVPLGLAALTGLIK